MTPTIRSRIHIACALAAILLSGCNDGSGSSNGGQTSAASSEIGRTGQRSVAISGQPGQVVSVGNKYSFRPTATAAAGASLTYSIVNQPTWADFDGSTGTLSGAPAAADVGTYDEISIAASDGLDKAMLSPFKIVVRPAMVVSGPEQPSISGTPAAAVLAGSTYSFTPNAADAQGATLSFAVQNLPSWAAFNTTTGTLSGSPTAADVGAFKNIVISVSDTAGSAALAAFSIEVTQPTSIVNSVALSWVAPSDNTNGTATDLSGYKIYYGASSGSLNQVVSVASTVNDYVFSQLAAGQWYFAVAAVNSDNIESALSAVASVQVGS